jgi:RimJ/RimL family protein N-acetyltransferase
MNDMSRAEWPLGPRVDSRPAERPQRTALVGRLVTVAPLDPARHGDSLYGGLCGAHNDDLWCYLLSGPFGDRASFDVYLEKSAVSKDPLFFSILDGASARALGIAAYLRVEPLDRVIEVGSIVFTRSLQRTAGATEAMFLMAAHAFETLRYRRYEWKCNALHERSRRAALRLGFTFEGIFRNHMISKGRSRDTAWFAMLDSEWPARRDALESWLDPENFDADGRQRVPLSSFRDRLSPPVNSVPAG